MPDGSTPQRARPRPVAGLPALDAEAAAKAWLLELLARAPLRDAAAVPVALLAAEAPALCSAIAAAVADDAALDRLQGEDAARAARAGALAGAVAPAEVVAAVEALRAVLHRALRAGDDAAVAADTADRVAHVCAQVAIAALGAQAPAADAARLVPPEAAPTAQDLRPDGGHVDAVRAALETPGSAPVTVLVIELDGLERLAAIEGADPLADALAPLEGALAAAARPDAVLVREQPGRWWLVAERTGTDAGRALAQRLVTVFAAEAPVRHGAALTASIGIAVFPDDGTELAALLEHADQGVFTARALGVPVA
jgi:GGDEF domain-containing protein